MDCPSRELLQDLVDGELRESVAAQVIEHLRSCDRCRREFGDILVLYEGLRLVVAKDPCPSQTTLEAYTKGALSSAMMATVRNHMVFCSECRSYVWLLTASESELAKWQAEEERDYRQYEAMNPGREAAKEVLARILPVGLEFWDRLWDSACQLVLELKTKTRKQWPQFATPGQLTGALGFVGASDPEATATSIIIVTTLLVAQQVADGDVGSTSEQIEAAVREATGIFGAGKELKKRLAETVPPILLRFYGPADAHTSV